MLPLHFRCVTVVSFAKFQNITPPIPRPGRLQVTMEIVASFQARATGLKQQQRRGSIVGQPGSMRAFIDRAKSFSMVRRALTLLAIAVDYNHLVRFERFGDNAKDPSS